MQFNREDHPHRRWNPLLEEWVLVSPHRARRPWTGSVEKTAEEVRPQHDPACYLCPGNTRAGGKQNPDYRQTFVFDNDFSALLPDPVEDGDRIHCGSLVRERAERGACRVICFSPRHDLTLAEMEPEAIRRVIDVWREQYVELGRREEIGAVLLFENKGAIMGCSNPHPHGQIWCTESVPNLLAKKVETQQRYHQEKGSLLLLDYLQWELEREERLLDRNEHFVSLVPHWAIWPFEAMILPRRPVSRIDELTEKERDAWAAILKALLVRFDNLFQTSFPYSMGIQQAPTDGGKHPGVQLHQHFFPPLLRSATIKKFQVGFEMSGEPQRDITPEQAAGRLRALPLEHYRSKSEGAL